MRTARLYALLSAALLISACGSTPPDPAAQYADDPEVVAVIAGDPLFLTTFEDEYARSVGGEDNAASDSLAEYQDFLQRYVDFRLKVREARALGFDADSSIVAEIQGYRSNLARPYLLENEVIEPVVRTMFERGRETISASHILIRLPENPTPADTLAAYNRIAALVDSVRMGADFGDVAFNNSEDPSARNQRRGIGYRGQLGYFSAGRMVEAFEDNAYATPVGELSPIFRTQFGYHVMLVEDRMEKQLDRDLSHILIRVTGSGQADSMQALERFEAVKARLAAGEPFEQVAGEASQDPGSARQGGRLGIITFDAPLVQSFKDVAFAIEEEGEIAEAETQFGFHLIRLNDIVELDSYEEAYPQLKEQVSRLPRSRRAEEAFGRQVLEERGVAVDTALVLEAFEGYSVDSLRQALVADALHASIDTLAFASIGDSVYTLGDWAAFHNANSIPNFAMRMEQIEKAIDNFLVNTAIDYEVSALEERDAEFAATMQQFRDGLILFKLMEEQVWNVAAADTAALVAYHAARADQYRFGERTRLISYYAPSDSLMTDALARLEAGMPVEEVADGGIEVDTTFVTGPTRSIYDRALEVELGERTEPFAYRQGQMVLVRDGVEAPRQKTFAEARTEVISDYQEVVEAELMARLRERYGVVTFPGKLVMAFDGVAAAADMVSAE
jgi:peptidyl-prolyl cis-trans isomerase SurA